MKIIERLKKVDNAYIILAIFIASYIFFYYPIVLGVVVAPLDALIGLYHPFRDLYASTNPNGIPYKNMLITDPVRQIIPWKDLVFTNFNMGNMPLWNPYEMAGKPLIGNFQSSAFYTFNFLILSNLKEMWSYFIALQQILAFVFMYFYLKNLSFTKKLALLGAFAFSFSGFVIAWLEWGTVIHTYLWLPLILLCIDKITSLTTGSKAVFKNKTTLMYSFLLLFATTSSFFAGHLQTFIYISFLSLGYFFMRYFEYGRNKKALLLFLGVGILTLVCTFVQWWPTQEFLALSARNSDQFATTAGWFTPPQNLAQYIAPDIFGNPATGNYFGVWNYAEFLGYVGVLILFCALLSLGIKKREVIFFQILFLLSLIFALDSPFTHWLYGQNIPFFVSTQPTRLAALTGFSIIVLGMYGLGKVIEKNTWKQVLVAALGFGILILTLWGLALQGIFSDLPENIQVIKRNLILPTGLFTASVFLVFLITFVKKDVFKGIIFVCLTILLAFDLMRVATKFTPFSDSEFFYPTSPSIEYLRKQDGTFRIAMLDSRILAPNIPTYYRLQTIQGYDPLYLDSYAKFISLSQRDTVDISAPYGFNRIITPQRLDSKYIDFLNVKYILSLDEVKNENWVKVFEEGQTKIYENKNVYPRAFFAENVVTASSDQDEAIALSKADLKTTATTQDNIENSTFGKGEVVIKSYSENKIALETNITQDGFLVLSDAYYPTWKAAIDGQDAKIYKTNLSFRGIIVPGGTKEIVLYNTFFK